MVDRKREQRNKAAGNYDVSHFNAIRHGILSRHVVLPKENRKEYDELHPALRKEYDPLGPMEDHLVEEIVGIIWRKVRLRLTEASVFKAGYSNSPSNRHEVRKSLE